MTNKKIVVTGIGTSSPLGGTARDSWTALLAGESSPLTTYHRTTPAQQTPAVHTPPRQATR